MGRAKLKEKEEAPVEAPTTHDARSMSLYVMTEEMYRLDEELEKLGGDISEGSEGESIAEKMEWLRELITRKVDNIIRYVRGLEVHADGLKDERTRLQQMERFDKNKIDRLKDICMQVMEKMGPDTKELKGELFKIRRVPNGGKPPIRLLEIDPNKWPEQYTRWEPVIDEAAVRASLESEKPDPALKKFAELQEKGHHIRFK